MSSGPARAPETAAEFEAAIRAGDRRALARAITLIESTRPDHQAQAADAGAGHPSKNGATLRQHCRFTSVLVIAHSSLS